MLRWGRVAVAGAVLLVWFGQAEAQAKKGCTVMSTWAPSEAEKALREGKAAEAEQMFSAMPPSSEATAGKVRALMQQARLREALMLAQAQSAAHPDDALLLDVLGEVRFRRGEVAEAATALNHSNQLDPCAARTYYDVSRYMMLSGLAKSAQSQLDLAHRLAPADPMIRTAWERTQRVVPTPEQQVANLKERMAKESTSAEEKADLAAAIKAVETKQKGDCQLASAVETAKVDMMPIGNTVGEGGGQASGLDVLLNGKRKRLELDTGASGMLITREAAASLGLTREAQIKTYGLGDSGMRDAYVTHVDSVRIGNMEFHNCVVRVIETRNVLPGQDGLIGADVFRNFLVTLDFPDKSLKLGPLPRRPDETGEKAALDTDGNEGEGVRTIAASRQDRYVAPEMKDWTKVFRAGHFIIFPTSIGKVPMKLFVMDTGSSGNLISPEAAREVTDVGVDHSMTLKGISGEVKKVSATGPITVSFGSVSQFTHGMASIDTSGLTRSSGTEISGFLGYETLKDLTISIDYRDNLVKVKFTPHLGQAGLNSQR